MTISLTGLAGLLLAVTALVILIRRLLAKRTPQRRDDGDDRADPYGPHDHTPETTHPVNAEAHGSADTSSSHPEASSSACETTTSSSDSSSSSSCDSSSSSSSSD
jgi:hypothetical protein